MRIPIRLAVALGVLALAACTVKGEKGEPGPAGPQGPAGPAGPVGPAGQGVDGGVQLGDLYDVQWATFHAAAVGICGSLDRDAGFVHNVLAYNPRTESCQTACNALRADGGAAIRCAGAVQLSVRIGSAGPSSRGAGTYYSALDCNTVYSTYEDSYELFPGATNSLTYYCCCS